MFTIGQFSKMTGISNKALIWYDNVGLLKPAKVNYENGYRYYDVESLKKVIDIHFLQEMGFSINEIINISSGNLEEKIENLQQKVDFINSNIALLQKFKEGNMKKEEITIFNVEEKLIQGKWVYRKTSTDFNDCLDTLKEGKKEKDMPKFLFFGEGNVGTDLKDIFGYRDCFTLLKDFNKKDDKNNKRDCWYFLINYRQTLVLYEKPKDEKSTEKINFHIYEKANNKTYTSKEIQYLCEKYSPVIGAKFKPFNENYIGKFKIYDQILESEIENYNGQTKNKDACYVLYPIFRVLDIQDNKDVYVMEDDDELNLKTSDGTRCFNRQNSRMTISMCQTDKADFYINNFNRQRHRGKYKKVGDEEFMFVDLDCCPDVNEEIYVFKKVK